MTVSDNTAESLRDFFRDLGKKGLRVFRRIAKNVLKNPERALKIGADIGTALATRSAKAALSSLPEVINFHHTGKGLYQEKIE